MYKCIGLVESSASRNNSCATTKVESESRICEIVGIKYGDKERDKYGSMEHNDAFSEEAGEDII